MPGRITEAASSGLEHAAFDGVPRTTGKSPPGGDESAMKLLMFVDGSSSLRDLAEVLTIDPAEIVRIVASLHEAGVIAFDAAFEAEWLREPREAPPEPAAEPPGEDEEAIRLLLEDGPSGPPAEEEPEEEPEELPGEIVEEGRLDDTPAWQVVTRIARTKFLGRIRFQDASGRREVLMMDGRPVYCLSDVESEDLASLLRARDLVSEEDYARVRESAGDAELSRVLVRLGMLPEYNRLRALRWQAQTLLFDLLGLESGTFLVERLEAYPRRTPRFDLSFSRILTRFLDEKMPVDEEVAKLQDKMELYVVPTEGASSQTFQEKEQRLWEVIQERPRRLKDVLSLSTLFKRETYKFVLLLLVNGLVELAKSVAVEEGPIDVRLLEDISEDMQDQNHYEVLGVHAVSDNEDVEQGYRRMAKRFDRAAFRNLDPGQTKALEAIGERIRQAHEYLRDEARRNEYRKQTFTSYQLAQFAQLQYQKGEIYLWWRQSPREAFPFFHSAMELDPAQPVYWAAFAMSALSGGSADPGVRRQAAKLAERVAALGNPDPVALVLAGGALIKLGQAGRGEECLKKATKLSPGNAAIGKMIRNVMKGSEG
jgi:tetratricopeptide (TPR) repeat protein